MTTGAFSTVPYLTSETAPRVLPLLVHAATVLPTGGGAVGPITGTQRVHAPGKSRKSYGIHARYVVVSRKIGTGVGPYTGASVTAKLAVGSLAQFGALPVNTVVTYAGQTDWVVVRQVPELIR